MAQILPKPEDQFDDILVAIHGIGAQSRNSTGVETITRVLTAPPPVWPAVLSAAAFFYLWWLANALSNKRLMTWRGYKVQAE